MEVNCRRKWKQIKGGALMKQKDVQTCPNCGSQNIGEGEFIGYAQIRKKETMFTSFTSRCLYLYRLREYPFIEGTEL